MLKVGFIKCPSWQLKNIYAIMYTAALSNNEGNFKFPEFKLDILKYFLSVTTDGLQQMLDFSNKVY